ncbi:MAG: [protein-PII] uridylyltransferase, partial [Alphaproteobacteria bacterium]|nr:[protein-PII] uridylyltransferase [Alphaproteobacteria bacterium]
APFSDLDLLFLLPNERTPYFESLIEYLLYMLWDLGLKVGHSSRSVDECMRQAQADTTIRTAMLEARWLWGDQELYKTFRKRFRTEIKGQVVDFVESKLAERDARHERMGDTRYVLEPNIKEGKGGLRDLHTLFWICRSLFGVSEMGELVSMGVLTRQDATRFAKAQNFMWTVRCHLHYLTGRPEERLTFDLQPAIARRMGYTDHAGARDVERFMRHYFLTAKDVGDLTRIVCAVLEEQHKRKPRFSLPSFTFWKREVDGFVIEGGRLNVSDPEAFSNTPLKLIKLFHAAHTHGIDIHPRALQLVTQNLGKLARLREDPEANRLFIDILTSKANPMLALRSLNESGVFGRFIPDFGRVVAQMQYDMYHVYTTDEHTIRAIGVLHSLEDGSMAEDAPLTSKVIHQIQSRRALYVAVLLHDIAKGRGGDHCELGAKVALKLGKRFGLSAEETETVSWLVEHHLLMTRTAFKRDIDDFATVDHFVRIVQSPERLRLLLILTCADIRAVSTVSWTGWKASLLRNLYMRAEEAMSGGEAAPSRLQRIEAAKDALRAVLADQPKEEVEAHMARGYPSYWLAFDTAAHERHAHLVMDAEKAGRSLTVDTRFDPARAATVVTVYTNDHPGLFSQIAGAIALAGESVVDAKIVTMANGMALDTFWIQGHTVGKPLASTKMKKITETIGEALSGRIQPVVEFKKPRSALPSRTHVFKVPPRVIVDNSASNTHTVVEVNGRDRPGLLFALTLALTRLGLQISSAQISTFGERVVDVFYVKDVFGMKVDHPGKLRDIRKGMLEALGDPSGSASADPPPPLPPPPIPKRRPRALGGKPVGG